MGSNHQVGLALLALAAVLTLRHALHTQGVKVSPLHPGRQGEGIRSKEGEPGSQSLEPGFEGHVWFW